MGKSGCLCDTHQRQTEVKSAHDQAISTHQSEWTRAHEVLCALNQTPECDIPPCPTVTQPTLAEGVANADTQHCTAAPTKSPTCNLKRDCKSNGGLNGCACPLG